jgi:6-phosphogluconate dehydrogenase
MISILIIMKNATFIRSARLPANLIQAQRDYFGAHTYELLSAPGKHVHTNWTGLGGNTSASTYDA